MTANFDKFFNTLLENLKGDLFQKSTREFSNERMDSPITNNQELLQRVSLLTPLAVKIDLKKYVNRGTVNSTDSNYGNYNLTQTRRAALEENWTTMLFRGHKVPNPFSKTGDSKAQGDRVYWAKNPDTALLYALNKSSWGTTGQQYTNVLQKASKGYGDNLQTKYAYGYISIAQPKYPERLKWYKNFGVEDEEKQRLDAVAKAKQEHLKQNPNKLFTGLPPNYKPNNIYGFTKDEWSKEDQRQKQFNKTDSNEFDRSKADWMKTNAQIGVPYEGGSKVANAPETALSPQEVIKVRTYLIIDEFLMISLNNIKKYDPVLYDVLLKDSL
jgi:hypothetical protein